MPADLMSLSQIWQLQRLFLVLEFTSCRVIS
jgi:hypothetical protein